MRVRASHLTSKCVKADSAYKRVLADNLLSNERYFQDCKFSRVQRLNCMVEGFSCNTKIENSYECGYLTCALTRSGVSTNGYNNFLI